MIKPIFIVGLPRTGSTLWSNIIDRDDKVMRFGEMHFLNPWHRDFRYFLKQNVGDLRKDANVIRMLDLLFSGQKYEGLRGNYWEQIQGVKPDLLKNNLKKSILESDRSLGAIFKALIIESTRIRGYHRCLIKFPVYVNHLDELFEWFPDAPVVHITRDPRGTAASKTSDPGGTAKRIREFPALKGVISMVMTMFVVIQYIWTSYSHIKAAHHQRYALYRYEDLLHDPETTITKLCNHIGIQFTNALLNPNSGQPSSLTGEIRGGFDRKSALHWELRLSPSQAKIILFLTKAAMRRLGYNPSKHPIYQ